jgi:hypothetical protein
MPPDEANHTSRRPKKLPSSAIREQFDLLDMDRIDFDTDDARAQPDLTDETFDPSQLRVSFHLQQGFATSRGITFDEAEAQLKETARFAFEHGNYRRTARGGHELWVGRFFIELTPESSIIYTFGKKAPPRAIPRPYGPPLSRTQLLTAIHPFMCPVLPRARAAFAKTHEIEKSHGVDEMLRHAFDRALKHGVWEDSDNPGDVYVLNHEGFRWVVGAVLAGVITVYSPEKPKTS